MDSLKSTHKTEIKRVGKFGAVGLFNTLIDFGLYNFFSSVIGLALVPSNLLSTTVAMLFSFGANKKVVFKKHDGHLGKQAVIFFAVTAFGLYILQTGTIHILTDVWLWPMHTVLRLVHLVGVTHHDEFIVKNGAKALATIISLAWNYTVYKKVVFK